MKYLITAVLVFLLLFEASAGHAESPFKARRYPGTHNTSEFVRGGCRACHAGSEMNRSVMDTCMQCHGIEKEALKAEKKRILSPDRKIQRALSKTNLRDEFDKTYRHPVRETQRLHHPYEEMPEMDSEAPRHVSCTDCHHHHYVRKDKVFAAIKGVNKDGINDIYAASEYEVCYRCHADSANLPVDHSNKRVEFDENNASFHPVVAEGRSTLVPSLIKPYVETYKEPGDISIIKCSDCHNNDDKNGPQGPHASKYPFILTRNYSIQDEIVESPQDYDLCYGCHKRSSILNDESFKFHSIHIKGNPISGAKGTSCFTCHDAHGSQEYTHLIRFNEDVVFNNPTTMEIKFVDNGVMKGECSLLCHGVSHNPKSYP